MSTNPFLKAYYNVLHNGRVVSPGGKKILEVENARIIFEPWDSIMSSFRARHFNLPYCKQEYLWYLRGDRFDTSIEQYASLWKKIRQPDGGFNSNYGQYLFGKSNQFGYAISALEQDRDSRQAVMVLLCREHLYRGNTDIVCTYSISLRIREDRLNMTVNMRSNDLIFGTTNDAFCFGIIHRMALAAIQVTYPEVSLGTYVHNVDSLHCYECHWEMLRDLVKEDVEGYTRLEVPNITIFDIEWLVSHPLETCNCDELEFAQWITR